jgi:hypothetical protein
MGVGKFTYDSHEIYVSLLHVTGSLLLLAFLLILAVQLMLTSLLLTSLMKMVH